MARRKAKMDASHVKDLGRGMSQNQGYSDRAGTARRQALSDDRQLPQVFGIGGVALQLWWSFVVAGPSAGRCGYRLSGDRVSDAVRRRCQADILDESRCSLPS